MPCLQDGLAEKAHREGRSDSTAFDVARVTVLQQRNVFFLFKRSFNSVTVEHQRNSVLVVLQANCSVIYLK